MLPVSKTVQRKQMGCRIIWKDTKEVVPGVCVVLFLKLWNWRIPPNKSTHSRYQTRHVPNANLCS